MGSIVRANKVGEKGEALPGTPKKRKGRLKKIIQMDTDCGVAIQSFNPVYESEPQAHALQHLPEVQPFYSVKSFLYVKHSNRSRALVQILCINV